MYIIGAEPNLPGPRRGPFDAGPRAPSGSRTSGCLRLWPGPGLEDGPADFGLPQRLVWGIGGADEVVLANRPVDRGRVLGHIGGEGAVRSVDFGAGAEVDDRCELCWRDHGGADAPDRLRQRVARKEDRDPSP